MVVFLSDGHSMNFSVEKLIIYVKEFVIIDAAGFRTLAKQ